MHRKNLEIFMCGMAAVLCLAAGLGPSEPVEVERPAVEASEATAEALPAVEVPAAEAPSESTQLPPAFTPMAWYPPPAICIPNNACSIPQDCPGGTCVRTQDPFGNWRGRCFCP